MTRKDYVMIAEAIADAAMGRDSRSDEARAIKTVAEYIADGLKADNSRFDRARFMAACGFAEGGAK